MVWKSSGLLIILLLSLAACHQHSHDPAGRHAGDDTARVDSAPTVGSALPTHNPSSLTGAPATPAGFFILLGVGLLTGFSHCMGMCGPLVGVFAARRRAVRPEISTSLFLFQSGRLTTYLILGAVLGSAGSLFAAALREWQALFSIIFGLALALSGLTLLGFLPRQPWPASIQLARFIGRWMSALMISKHPAAPFGLGLANGLLPCGSVYGMSLLAAATAEPLAGASLMLIFGLGTLPAMLGLGLAASRFSLRLRSRLYRLAALLVIIVGLQLALRGLALGGQISHAALGGVMLW